MGRWWWFLGECDQQGLIAVLQLIEDQAGTGSRLRNLNAIGFFLWAGHWCFGLSMSGFWAGAHFTWNSVLHQHRASACCFSFFWIPRKVLYLFREKKGKCYKVFPSRQGKRTLTTVKIGYHWTQERKNCIYDRSPPVLARTEQALDDTCCRFKCLLKDKLNHSLH